MDLSNLTDGDLLARFARERSEACFEELVRRHGPMVLNVCRRVLGHSQDAEDAAQAVFLTLAQKAASLAGRPSAAGWLHHVSRGVAMNAREARAARTRREKEADVANAPAPMLGETWARLEPVLDGELEALPEKYRLPIVLCHLEGRSLAEASALLQCKQGTLESWLTRGRDMLKDRLARRGLALSVAVLGALLSKQAAAAELPAAFVPVTVKTASLLAAGNAAAAGAVSSQVSALTQGALHMLYVAKVKSAAAVFAAVILIGAGAGVVAYHAAAEDNAKPAASAPAQLTVQETTIHVDEWGRRTVDLPLLEVEEGRPTDPYVGVFLTKQICEVLIGGKKAELTDLKDGDRVKISYEKARANYFKIEWLAGPHAGNAPIVEAGEADKGKTLKLKVGQTLRVTLKSNQTMTGWEGGVSAPKNILKDTPAAFTHDPKHEGETIGTYVFSYTAAAPGTAKLRMVYVYPSGPTLTERLRTKLVREFEVTVDVENAANTPDAAGLWIKPLPIKLGAGPLAFTRDGKRMAVVQGNWSPGRYDAAGKEIPVPGNWEIELFEHTGKQAGHFAGHQGKPIRDLAFSHDGTLLVSCGYDCMVRVWDVASQKQLHAWQADPSGSGLLGAVFLDDGKLVAAVSSSGRGGVWSLDDAKNSPQSQQAKWMFDGYALAASPNGKQLLVTKRALAEVYDAKSGVLVRSVPVHELDVRGVSISRDGKWAATSGYGYDSPARIWDFESGKERFKLPMKGKYGSMLAISPDGSALATLANDNDGPTGGGPGAKPSPLIVRVWSIETGKERFKLVEGATSIAFAPDGALAIGDASGVTFWNVRTGEAFGK